MVDLEFSDKTDIQADNSAFPGEEISPLVIQQASIDIPLGYGVKYLLGRWSVVEIRVNPEGKREHSSQEKSFVSVGIAEQEAKRQAVVTRTKFLGEQR
jgi:hypothetical protein